MRKLRVTEMGRLTVDEYRRAAKVPLTVVLDGVRSAHNVGSILRTCDAFRIAGVMLCGITPAPPSAEIHKTALGAEDSVSWRHYATTTEAIAALRAEGCHRVWAVEQCEGSTTLRQATHHMTTLPHGTPVAIVLGNEVHGVGQEAIDLCDACIEIAQYGTKHSLNVAVAAGIVIHALATTADREGEAGREAAMQ